MTWWQAVLSTVGVVGFWPAALAVGDPIDRWWQARQARQMARPGERERTVGGE